ncbi:MAG TPA: TIR domain-containing protein [Kofleriaceae bacterium]|nr:TIR domain-containing protein [Kofleriaceae bacterium]
MTQLVTPTATRLEFYLVWLALRRVARSEGAVAEPLRQAISSFFDRMDALLDLDIGREHRQEIADVLATVRGTRLVNGALRSTCARLADLLALVLSEPDVPLRRPKIDQVTYIRLLQLALHIDENEHGAGEDLWAEQLAARANVALDRVHAAIARMLSDGIVHLPVGDEGGRPDVFRLNDPATAEEVLFSPDVDRDWYGSRDDDEAAEDSTPNPREVVVIYGRETPRTAFFFELLRRIKLRPIPFHDLVTRAGSSHLPIRDVVRSAFAQAQAVVVLFTGDDLPDARPDQPIPPPNPHIIFEAGVAVALQHARTVLVEVPPHHGFLDLADVHVVQFSTGAPEERTQLVRRLRAAGCELVTLGDQWLSLEFPP